MTGRVRTRFAGGAMVTLSLCLLFAAGCNKSSETNTSSEGPSGSSGGRMMSGGPGGGGRRGGGPGGPGGGPIAANASGEDIYQAKCGCHGPGGKGGKAPVLTGGAGKSEEELIKIIHDGKDKMPAFSSQLSDDQIKKVASAVKAFK